MQQRSVRGLLVVVAIAAVGAVATVPRAVADTASADLRAWGSGPATAKAGEAFSYSFVVTNDGLDAASSVTATVSMPAHATGIPAVAGGSLCTAGTPQARVCTLGTLTNADTRTIVVNGSFRDAGPATLSVAVSSATADPDSSDNGASVTTTVSRVSADLRLSLVRVNSPILVGGFSDYLIKAENLGPDAVGGLQVTDTNPSTMGAAQASGSNSSSLNCSFGGSQVNCNDGPTFCSTPSPSPGPSLVSRCEANGALAAGQSLFFRFTGNPVVSGTVVNTAAVTAWAVDDPNTADNTTQTTIEVTATANLGVAMDAPGSSVQSAPFDLTVSVTNNGPDVAENTTTSTTLPAGVAFVSGAGCTGPNPVVCDFGDVADDAAPSKTISLRGDTLGNATITTSVTSATADNVATNNSASRTITVVEEEQPEGADLRATATGPATAKAGSPFTYTFAVVNDGFDEATAVSATVSMPPHAVGLPSVVGGALCTGGTPTARVCPIGALSNGEARTISVSGSYGAAVPTTLSVAVTSATVDPHPANNSASVTTTVSRVNADLKLSLVRVNSPIAVGAFSDYLIRVENAGPDPVGGLVVTDTNPSTMGDAQASGGNSSSVSCFFGGSQVNCTDGPTSCSTPSPTPGTSLVSTCRANGVLGAGQSLFFRFTGRAVSSGTIVNTATVSGTAVDDPSTGDNTLQTTIQVTAAADLALAVVVPGSAPVNGEFDYELSVTNNGPDAAAATTTTTTLPAGVTLVSAAGCTGTTTVTCNLGAVADEATVQKTLRLRGTAAGNAVISSTVASDVHDHASGNNAVSRTVTILPNAVPTAEAGGPYAVDEGGSVTLAGVGTDANGDALTFAWDVDGDGTFETVGQSVVFSAATADGPGTLAVGLRVCDPSGACVTDTAVVSIQNVAPTATIAAPASTDEGGSFTVALVNGGDPSAADVAAGFSYAFDCGAGYGAFGASSSTTCAAGDGPAARAVRATIRDRDGGEREYTAGVQIDNVAPTARFVAPTTIAGGSSFGLALADAADASSADAGAGFSYAFDCGDGSGYGAFGPSSSAACATNDDGARTVRAKVRDRDGGTREYADTTQVTNVPPTCGPIAAPLTPVAVGSPVAMSAPIADPESADLHAATVTWGDGTSSPAAVADGAASATHAYSVAGVYTVALDVADDDGASGSCVFQFVVAYDPSAGFVTGGGWIDSPAGASVAAPAATGKASFGFVAKYLRGATTPTGQAEFQFRAGALDFRSTDYEWLVVAGARAKFKGTGRIGGAGSYSFMLTAIDGQRSGGGGVDRFRIKIWDSGTGSLVYDNQLGAPDAGDAATALGGGSIVVHGN